MADPFHTTPKFKMSEFNTMLQWSALAYSYATLRDIVRDHEITIPENKDNEDAVAFTQPDLIYTQHHGEEPEFKDTHMKYPVTAVAILKFIKLNRRFLKDEEGTLTFDKDGDAHLEEGGDKVLNISRRLMQVDDEFDADIVDFDDEFVEEGMKSELVYSIIANRSEKRITVVFRGSVSLKDWITDANMSKVNPEEVKAFAGESVFMHEGFCEYLLGHTSCDKGMSKYEQIVSILKQLYAYKKNGRDYSGYDLYITGHSLGGALSQVLAFILAGNLETLGLPIKKVHAITYASPMCGEINYKKAFAALEKEGKLRHIRVSNKGDVVCVGPFFNYIQTGVNLHVNGYGALQAGYNTERSFFSQLNLGAGGKHSLKSYHPHLFKDENEEIIGMSVEELYTKYAGDFICKEEGSSSKAMPVATLVAVAGISAAVLSRKS